MNISLSLSAKRSINSSSALKHILYGSHFQRQSCQECSKKNSVDQLIRQICQSVTQSCPALWNLMHCSTSRSITNSRTLLMSIKSVMLSNHLILCHPLLHLPPVFPSIRIFSNESVLCIRWPNYWSFGFSLSPSNEYSGLISFRIDWFELLVVQGALKSLLQHHSSKASVLQCSAFFMV